MIEIREHVQTGGEGELERLGEKCRMLWAAVLHQLYDDLSNEKYRSTLQRFVKYDVGFTSICLVVGVDHEKVREEMLGVKCRKMVQEGGKCPRDCTNRCSDRA